MAAAITVTGGVGGIVAEIDDLRTLARLYGDAACDCGGMSAALHGYLLDVGNLVSVAFDPAGAAEFEFALEAALDGTGGATRLAVRCVVLGMQLRAAAETYEVFTDLDRVTAPVAQSLWALPGALEAGWRGFERSRNPLLGLDALVAADPRLADVAVIDAEVLATSTKYGPQVLKAFPAAEQADDGRPHLRDAGPDPRGDALGPPHSFAALMAGLIRRNDSADGEIDVRKVIGRDGRAAYIVDIPGTKSWDPLPNGDITSVVTDLRSVTGQQTSYERGVLDAMSAAGIKPTDPVMLVGHSEGGMVAVNAAIHCAQDGRFAITNVVTAGAPIGPTSAEVPRKVQVLALENTGDVVPHLDGIDNAPLPNVTTVTINHDHGEVLDNHDLALSYLPGAKDVDASTDPSIDAFRRSATSFLDGKRVSTRTYVITRTY